MGSGLDSIEDILADLAAGKMVVIMDDEHRENEGDLVMAACKVRPEDINFMARLGRGLICLTLTEERCRQLRLPLMVSDTHREHRTNFTLSIEAAEGVTTGISAYDRAHTVRTAVAPQARPQDLRQPGHIFPIMAQPGGVLTRAGHTEAGCDLARLAGLEPAAVIVEIMNDDGTMARRPDLERFAREHGLRVVEDAAHAIGTTWKGRRIGSFGDFIAFSFHPNKNMTSIEGGALVIGDASAVEMVERQRFHGLTRRPDGSMDATIAGGKYNLSDVAACLGHAQLKKLDGFNERRRLLVDRYFSNFGTDAPVELPPRGEGHTWHMFAPLLDLDGMTTDRAGFISRMKDRNIGLGIHYDALHLFTVYREMGNRPGQCPNAEHIGRTTVTLPLFPTMQDSDVDRVCDAVREVICEVRK